MTESVRKTKSWQALSDLPAPKYESRKERRDTGFGNPIRTRRFAGHLDGADGRETEFGVSVAFHKAEQSTSHTSGGKAGHPGVFRGRIEQKAPFWTKPPAVGSPLRHD
jgi:hypothetical protein